MFFISGMPFGIIGMLFPLIFFIFAVRIIRSVFRASHRRNLETRIRREGLAGPYDEYSTVSRYPGPPPVKRNTEGQIFRLADKMKGRITLSDIVIATNMSLSEAEQVIESMVDGMHVTMEVDDNGKVVYEFPEIISRYENPN